MPALRAWISRFSLLLCVLLTACDRHNDITDTDALPDDEEVLCDWESTFREEDVPYVDGVRITNAYDDERFSIPFDDVFSPNDFEYEINTSFLVNSVSLSVDNEVEVSQFPGVLNSLVIEINGEQLEQDESATIQLEAGIINTVEMDVTVTKVEQLVTKDEETCGYPSEQEIKRALAAGDPPPIPTRNVVVPLNYTFDINRQAQDVMTASAYQVNSSRISTLDEHDQLGSQVLMGRIITESIAGLTRDIMVLGVPLEDSNARGVFESADLADEFNEAQDNSSADSGAVFIYERNSVGEWELSHYIKSSNSDAGDRFGSALALYDNLLVVSALDEDSSSSGLNGPMDNNLAMESGAVYVFEYDQGNWHQTNYIKPPVNSVGIDGYDDDFGYSLSFDSGYLIISAPKEDSSNGEGGNVNVPNSGAVYLYAVNETEEGLRGFQYVDVFKAKIPNLNDNFGASVAMSPGGTQFLIGAPGEDSNYRGGLVLEGVNSTTPEWSFLDNNSANDSGAVYIFQRGNLNQWSPEAQVYLKSSNSDAGDQFGAQVRFLSDDILLVGAPLEDSDGDHFDSNPNHNNAPDSGAAYLYVLNEDDLWIEKHYIKSPASEADQYFGSALTSYEGSFMISAPRAQNAPGEFNGAVYGYLFDQEKSFNQQLTHFLTLPAKDLDPEVITTDERFGNSVSLFGTTLVVGAPGQNDLEGGGFLERAGGAYIYQ